MNVAIGRREVVTIDMRTGWTYSVWQSENIWGFPHSFWTCFVHFRLF